MTKPAAMYNIESKIFNPALLLYVGPPPCVAVLTPVEVESPETLRSLSNCSTQQPQDSPGPEVTQEEVIFSPNTTKEQSGQLQSNDKE